MTVKVPPKGTRGLPIPRFINRFANRMVVRQFRRGGMRSQGGVSATPPGNGGCEVGQASRGGVGLPRGGTRSWLVIASMAGAAYHPSWLYNLASQPDATIEFADGRRVPVRAETLDGTDLKGAWARIATEAPEYAKYRTKTDRDIPVLRLRQR